MEPSPSPDTPWRSGLQGARANLLPGIALQIVAVVLVLGYYNVARVHGALDGLMAFSRAAGPVLGILTTALFGGFLPFLYLHYFQGRGDEKPRYGWVQGMCLTAFWGYKGLEVGYWYRLQAVICGSGHSPGTIAVKVFLDQFVYCPIVAVPLTVAVYQAVEAHSVAAPLADLRIPGWYRRSVLPVLISNLGVWVPAVAAIYCLPTPLQLPLQNIVLCFYTLVVAHQIRPDASAV
jgi:hypothetical protein